MKQIQAKRKKGSAVSPPPEKVEKVQVVEKTAEGFVPVKKVLALINDEIKRHQQPHDLEYSAVDALKELKDKVREWDKVDVDNVRPAKKGLAPVPVPKPQKSPGEKQPEEEKTPKKK